MERIHRFQFLVSYEMKHLISMLTITAMLSLALTGCQQEPPKPQKPQSSRPPLNMTLREAKSKLKIGMGYQQVEAKFGQARMSHRTNGVPTSGQYFVKDGAISLQYSDGKISKIYENPGAKDDLP